MISLASTFIVAPLARVIPVVLPPLIESYEAILAASVVASTVVSVTAIVVRPPALVNSLLVIAVAKVPRSARLLPASAVTLVRLITTDAETASLIVFNCAAVDDVASDSLIIIVKAFTPPSSFNVASSVTDSVVNIVAVTLPVVVSPKRFALSTVIAPVTVIS